MSLSTIPDSKILKKWVQIGPKLKHELGTQKGHSTLLDADWPKFLGRPKDSLIEIKPIFFNFFEIRTHSNSYLIIQLIFRSIPTSINRGNKSKVGVPLFWLFNSPYVKDILEAFALGTSFL